MDLWLPPKPAIIRPAPADLRRANFLPGWFPGAVAGPSGPDFSHTASTQDDSNALIYTFSSQSFGADASDRRIIVAAYASAANINASTSQITIGGTSATIHAQAQNTGNTRNGIVAIASASVPTGASGDIVVTYTADEFTVLLGCAISVYRAAGLVSGTPFDTATDFGASPSLLIDIPAQGFLVACSSGVSGTLTSWPSPMVMDSDGGSDGVRLSGAHAPVQFAASTNFAAGPSVTGGSSPSRCAAVTWR
jgi:hypothetical protein